MKESILEINDQEYLIKLKKEDFDLSLISRLLKKIKSEQFSYNKQYEIGDLKSRHLDLDYSSRFDHLSDK